MKPNNETTYKGMKAFLIARVSDPSQREALPAQELRLNDYARRLELDAELYSFDETAYKEDRQQFQQIVKKISGYPNQSIVVFDKVDRFTRDSSAEVVRVMKSLVRQGSIELHFPSDSLYIHKNSPASDITRLGMNMIFGEYYSAAISDNVKRRIAQKLHDGEYPGKSCIGYKNVKYTVSGKEIKNTVPDPDRKQYIVKAFELRLEGKSYRTIAKILKNGGLRSNTAKQGIVGQNQIETMLKNPFYYGVMRYDGRLYKHKYEPIISKQMFDRVQNVNDTRSNDRTRTDTKRAYTFNGILKCGSCGCTISSYEKKGRVYMRCTRASDRPCDQPHIPESAVLPQVSEMLEKIRISQDVVRQVLDVLKSEHDNIQLFYQNAISQTREECNRLKKKLDTLYEDRLDGRITVNEYDKYVTRYKSEIDELETKLVAYTNDDKSFIATSEYLLELASRAKDIFENSQPEQKNKILRMVSANLTLHQKRLQLHLLKPFSDLCNSTKSSNWLRRLDSNQRPID